MRKVIYRQVRKASWKRCHIRAELTKRSQFYEENIPGRKKSKCKGYEPFHMFEKMQKADVTRKKCSKAEKKLGKRSSG